MNFVVPSPAAGAAVLRTTENRQYIFHELDPISGIGRELARTGWTAPTVGDWSLSPNGSEVAIPNHDDRERRIHFIALDPPSTGETERDMIVAGPGRLKGVSWAADGRGWFATLMSDEDLSRPSLDGNVRLVYVDSEGRSRVLGEFSFSTWGVPSPDGPSAWHSSSPTSTATPGCSTAPDIQQNAATVWRGTVAARSDLAVEAGPIEPGRGNRSPW